jgi:microcin C transport system ATP-binding protein
VVGESGSGKTTLAMAILRLTSSEGPILFLGQNIAGRSSRQLRPLRAQMQVVFQDPYGSLSPRMTVEEIIAEGLGVHGVPEGKDPRDMVADDHARGGPRSRHHAPLPARILGRPAPAHRHRPRHDPAPEAGGPGRADLGARHDRAGADRRTAAHLQKRHRLAYVFISHDLRVVRAMSHQIVVMKDGDVVEAGPAERIFDAPQEPYTRALLAAAFDLRTIGKTEVTAS